MNPRSQVAIGLGIVIAGLVATAVGVAVASHDLFVGLILMLLFPLSISFCGAVLALIGLLRQPEAGSRSAFIRRIIGGTALACVASGFGYGALSILSQLPDWFAGLNSAYLPVPAVSAFLLPGMSLLLGLGLGSLAALIWWTARGRHVPTAEAAQNPG